MLVLTLSLYCFTCAEHFTAKLDRERWALPSFRRHSLHCITIEEALSEPITNPELPQPALDRHILDHYTVLYDFAILRSSLFELM